MNRIFYYVVGLFVVYVPALWLLCGCCSTAAIVKERQVRGWGGGVAALYPSVGQIRTWLGCPCVVGMSPESQTGIH